MVALQVGELVSYTDVSRKTVYCWFCLLLQHTGFLQISVKEKSKNRTGGRNAYIHHFALSVMPMPSACVQIHPLVS